jgi:glycosyltransferase involved in cell wall biosynthesis
MNIVILTPALIEGDGVGNDVLGMAKTLRAAGHSVSLAVRFESPFPTVPLARVPDLIRRPDDVLIYHHSIGCAEAIELVERLPCRKIVKYHNVTPPRFFLEHNPEVARGCAEGERQLQPLLRTGAAFWADSPFNRRELERVRPDVPCAILPPFNQVDRLLATEPEMASVGLYDDWLTNILVVGRVVPNKNVTRSIEAFAVYLQRHNPNARLILVGDLGQNEYCDSVLSRIRELGLGRHVFITGKLSLAQLKAFYLTAQVLLTTSLHEGFCLPLLEAMGLRVPVVALPNGAIPETGGDVPVYADDDPNALADALTAVRADPDELEDRLDRGWQRYQSQFDNAAIARRFLELLSAVLQGEPASPAGHRAR